MAFVCFDAGGTAVKYGLFSTIGELLEKGEYPTPLETKEAFYQALIQKVKHFGAGHPIEGIGICLPGFINPDSGEAMTAGALSALYGENLITAIQEELPYPMAVENDANCAALAEMASGHALGIENFLLMTIGTGIGGAVVINGELYRGHSYRAGEFGMMHIDMSSNPYATAHDLAATSSLVRAYKIAKGIDPSTSIDARLILQEKETDLQTAQIFTDWLDYLAAVIFNVATFFNPQKILLGGGISANSTLIPALEERLKLDKDWEDMRTVIQSCKYYNEAGLRGAYALIAETVNKNTFI